MRRSAGLWLAAIVLGACGCNQNPFGPGPQQGAYWRQPAADAQPPYVAQLQELDQRNRRLDANNNDLHKQLAQSQQREQMLSQEVSLYRKRLEDMANQLETTQLAKETAERQVQTMQASTRFRGGATITANSSLKQTLQVANLPGLDIRQDGDVIRIVLPADQLFAPGTVQWQPQASNILDQVAQGLTQNYPRQLVAIEAHVDSQSARTPGGLHQLTASQALAVLQQMTQRNRIPEKQLFMINHGANQPLLSNGTAAGQAKNRRIEIVIYPETFS